VNRRTDLTGIKYALVFLDACRTSEDSPILYFCGHACSEDFIRKSMEGARQARQAQTVQDVLDAIVWEWDSPYLDAGDWKPLKE
jgi:hypothetical protein